MKILKTILVLLNLTPIYSFVSSNLIRRPSLNIFKKSNSFKLKEKPNTEYKNITINNNSNNLNNLNNLNISNNSNNLNNTNNTNIVAQKHNVVNTKITGFLKISRSNNILSTLFLCFTGGWIMNPNVNNVIYSKKFIIFTINTILIMSASMVLNDMYDIELDKINKPKRPLITGEVSMKEALLYSVFLLSISEYLSLKYLPINLQWVIHLSIIYINLYTPIFKKILIIKNLSCAFLISSTLFFTGLATSNKILSIDKNFDLLIISCNTIFFGSLTNEILMDIRDYKGDKKNNLKTIPIIFGIHFAWIFSNILMYSNLLFITLILTQLYNKTISSIFIFIMIPQLIHLYKIKGEKYSDISIKKFIDYSNVTLFLLLSYFCGLTR